MNFWFYETPMSEDYCSNVVSESTKKAIVSWLINNKVYALPEAIGEFLDEIRCLQTYLLGRRPRLINIDLYTGETDVIVINRRSFYYVDKIGETIVIRGLSGNMFVKYDMDLVNLSGEVKHYLLCYSESSSEAIDKDVSYIVSKFKSKEATNLDDMKAF